MTDSITTMEGGRGRGKLWLNINKRRNRWRGLAERLGRVNGNIDGEERKEPRSI